MYTCRSERIIAHWIRLNYFTTAHKVPRLFSFIVSPVTPKARPPTATPPGRSPLSGACPCLCWLDPRTLWQLRLLSCPTRRQFLWRQSLNGRDVVVLIVCTGSKLVSNFRKYWVGSHSDHSYQDKLYIMDIESKNGIEWISRVVCIIA